MEQYWRNPFILSPWITEQIAGIELQSSTEVDVKRKNGSQEDAD